MILSNLFRVLRDPKGAEGNGAPAGKKEGGISAAAKANQVEQESTMAAVFDRLGLPADLMGEPEKKAESGKQKAQKAEGDKDDTTEAQRHGEKKDEGEQGEGEAAAEVTGDESKALLESLSEEDRAALEKMDAKERDEIVKSLVLEDRKTAAAAKAEEEAEAPEFSEEQQAWVKALEAKQAVELTETKQKLDAAAAELEDVKGKLESAGDTGMEIAPIHPLFMTDKAEEIAQVEGQLQAFEKWALKNWDGTEEVTKDGQVTTPAYSKEQIRERYAELKEVREKLVPAARQRLEGRQKETEAARKVYPELFDPKRPESKVAQNLLKLAPGLKAVVPNIYVVIGDALVGEKLRLAKAKGKASRLPAAGKTRLPLARRPGPGLGAAGGAAKGNGENGATAKRFQELGGDRDALISLIRESQLPTQKKGREE